MFLTISVRIFFHIIGEIFTLLDFIFSTELSANVINFQVLLHLQEIIQLQGATSPMKAHVALMLDTKQFVFNEEY